MPGQWSLPGCKAQNRRNEWMKKLGIWLCVLLMLVFGMVPVNAFAAESETVSIPVRVLLEGSEPDRKAEYAVELIAQTPG